MSDKDKIIKDLSDTLKRYAGFNERRIDGRPKESWNCEGFGWVNQGTKEKPIWVHVYMNNVGMVDDGGGPELAIKKLREYNLIEE
jgi:hypothetical protein